MTTANKLTIFRILLIPVFMYFFFSDIPYSIYIAITIFVIASLTDSIDGYMARKYNQITTFGKLMDPLADKLLVTSALISFVEKGYIGSWVAVLIISREFIVTGLRIVAISENKVIAASNWGKAKTISQIIAIIVIMLNTTFLGSIFAEINLVFYSILITTLLTLYSGIDYIVKNLNIIEFK